MQKLILAVGTVALMSLAAPASAFSRPCYGEAMRCRQDQGWKQQTRQQESGASAQHDTPTQPRRAKHPRP